MNRWSESDPYNAAVWLGTLPQGESRDAAVSSFTRRIASSNPEAAAQWAESISDQNIRNRQVESIALTWLRIDATTATAWVTRSSLPAETKARLLAQNK
jgi:hypothetical protein